MKRMTYQELVSDMNQDLKALEQIEKPITLYKEEKQEVAERIQRQDESLKKVKMIVWPIWTVVIIVNSILLVAYNKQQVQIRRNQQKIDDLEKFNSYRYA